MSIIELTLYGFFFLHKTVAVWEVDLSTEMQKMQQGKKQSAGFVPLGKPSEMFSVFQTLEMFNPKNVLRHCLP